MVVKRCAKPCLWISTSVYLARVCPILLRLLCDIRIASTVISSRKFHPITQCRRLLWILLRTSDFYRLSSHNDPVVDARISDAGANRGKCRGWDVEWMAYSIIAEARTPREFQIGNEL